MRRFSILLLLASLAGGCASGDNVPRAVRWRCSEQAEEGWSTMSGRLIVFGPQINRERYEACLRAIDWGCAVEADEWGWGNPEKYAACLAQKKGTPPARPRS